jgi:phosphoadenosine phosphosulfate reductase
MMLKVLTFLAALGGSAAFSPVAMRSSSTALRMAETETVFDQEQFVAQSKEMRMKHLEEQAMFALKISVENYGTLET